MSYRIHRSLYGPEAHISGRRESSSMQAPIELDRHHGSQAPCTGTFCWNMSPDYLVVSHGGFHLLINVPRVIREVYAWNPNRLMFRALDCANEKVRNALGYSASGVHQFDKAKSCKFWDTRSKYCRVPDYSTGVICSQLVR